MPGEGATLGEVAAALGATVESPQVMVTDVHHDSRRVGPGELFVAIVGATSDGHDFAAAAVARGAAGVVVERRLDLDVPQIVVADARAALAAAASAVHRHPGKRLRIVGVTGTNGKTTVTHMVEALCRDAGLATGLIGTLGARIGEDPVPLERTTPEASDTQRLFARMVAAGVDVVAMEVSSHALELHRADAIDFRVAAFTNLSQDHLDFHPDMEAYFAAKASLFTAGRAERAVVWVDDAWGERMAAASAVPVTRVGAGPGDDVSGTTLHTDAWGSDVRFAAGEKSCDVRLPLPARFNVANALVAAAVGLELGIPFETLCAGLARLPQVPGRFEAVAGERPFQVVVDYAHTPDAVAGAIGEARALVGGRVLALVGAGGDRDRAKRPLMGSAAAEADVTVVTSDNPRSEDPDAIVSEVVAGIPQTHPMIVEPDRRKAIGRILAEARPGDIVLVLGKGHEQGQEFAGGRIEPFDDRRVVREKAIVVLGGAAP
jgi:UDP-N-acetylmuramoyl-L-alanyl-D-glutamate--2,6-diaminopimelate ligase